MASLIPGYEYDIFISYRQKDNKYDGWVTEFVGNLRKELEATFKEEISVYFDINPSDYLLETYDVNDTLKDKLKCLIFIPIISRTYCDPRSFAWENEFKAFVEQASNDRFGLKVKLPNGSVAGRVLPIQIHELKNEDKVLIEKVLGALLRSIEFIYKEPGVNRPLRSNEDHPDNNLNKTYYRNQINKVANAIDEIVSVFKAETGISLSEKTELKDTAGEVIRTVATSTKDKPGKSFIIKLFPVILVMLILVISGIIVYPRFFKPDTLEKLRLSGGKITVAVMPFRNMTNDTEWDVIQNGLQGNVISSLCGSPEYIIVRQAESIEDLLGDNKSVSYSSVTPEVAGKISQKLDADVFIYGLIEKAGFVFRVSAQLTDTKTKTVFKVFQVEDSAKYEKIFKTGDSLSGLIRDYLIISGLGKNIPPSLHKSTSTSVPEALRYYILGQNAYYRRDYPEASDYLTTALEKDSGYIEAAIALSYSFLWQEKYQDARKWCKKVYGRKDQVSPYDKIIIERLYAQIFLTPIEVIKLTIKLKEFDDQSPVLYYALGWCYYLVQQYDKAIPELTRSLNIYKEWETDPPWINNYYFLALAYHKTGELKKEKRVLKEAEKLFPDATRLLYSMAKLDLSEGKAKKADEYIKKYISVLKNNSYSDASVANSLANLYTDAKLPDSAEKYFRKTISIEPGNLTWTNNLAYFLINNDRDVKQGLELAKKILEINPDNYFFLHSMGWGLYKIGEFQEAEQILQKSWDIRREKAVYDHTAFLHLEAAKKAVAGMK